MWVTFGADWALKMSKGIHDPFPSSAMPIQRGAVAAIMLCLACASGGQPRTLAASQVFSLSVGCSSSRNPNGVWEYGYTIGQALVASAFRRDGFHDSGRPIGFWQPNSKPGVGHFPYVVCNPSAKTELYGELGTPRGWAARAGQVAMEASNVGQYSVVRFTAPVAGSYRVTARFEGIHFGLSTTDVHVMQGATSLFTARSTVTAATLRFTPSWVQTRWRSTPGGEARDRRYHRLRGRLRKEPHALL